MTAIFLPTQSPMNPKAIIPAIDPREEAEASSDSEAGVSPTPVGSELSYCIRIDMTISTTKALYAFAKNPDPNLISSFV